MEKYSRTQHLEIEDSISELPDALLLLILTYLPTKDVLVTSVLSKRWQYIWTMVPKLEYKSYNLNIENLSEIVGRFLFSHKAPVLESVSLKVIDRYESAIDIRIWSYALSKRHVRELELDLMYKGLVIFPSSFFFDTLEILKLKNTIFVDVPLKVSMKSLRTLHLECVNYKDDESIRNIFSSCPNLETLVVIRWFSDGVMNFNIVTPSLKNLTIKDYTLNQKNRVYVINAPSLKQLVISGLCCKCCLIENAFELVEASISNVYCIVNEEIIGSLVSAKRISLDLSPLEVKCPSDSIFYKLVHLEIYTCREEWWNLLRIMLVSSPKLQVLKLIDSRRQILTYSKKVTRGKLKEPKHVPECLLSHLETIVWTRFNWTREEEKEIATYILKNAICLKIATFSIRSVDFYEFEERCKMVNELNRVMASKSCNLVLNHESS